MFEVESGIELLEGRLSDILLSLDDVCMIRCGDLNGRISNRFPDTASIINNQHTPYKHLETERISKRSEDKTLNSFEKQLLNMCSALDLCIMNCVCNGDHLGCYTYISDTGNRVNDFKKKTGN